jgi:hypothetical protein
MNIVKPALDLVRVGNDNDGGYLISRKDIEYSDTLIGIGLSNDWSFEMDFCSYMDIPTIVYDGSVSKKYFFNQIIKSIPRLDKPNMFFNSIKTYLSYLSFFKNKHKHIEKFVGVYNDNNFCNINSVFKETDSSKIFLKIDIEGGEYRILNDLLMIESRLTGLAIELHDCDLHLIKIKNFIENLKMPLVHIHANNFSPINPNNNLPVTLELTFSKHAALTENIFLPHKFDMPNNEMADEIILTF